MAVSYRDLIHGPQGQGNLLNRAPMVEAAPGVPIYGNLQGIDQYRGVTSDLAKLLEGDPDSYIYESGNSFMGSLGPTGEGGGAGYDIYGNWKSSLTPSHGEVTPEGQYWTQAQAALAQLNILRGQVADIQQQQAEAAQHGTGNALIQLYDQDGRPQEIVQEGQPLPPNRYKSPAESALARNEGYLMDTLKASPASVLERIYNTPAFQLAYGSGAADAAKNGQLVDPLVLFKGSANARLFRELYGESALQDPNNQNFQTSPGYQFRLNEGLKNVRQQAASQGLLNSGNTLKQ